MGSWHQGTRVLRAVGSRALSTATTAAPISSKAAKRSWSYMSEVLGNPGLAGRNFRIQAGELLKVIDLCAASSAMKHAGHAVCPTLSFDRVELLVPICHGDLVHMDARVVSVGNSTMVIQVLGRKKDVQTRQWVFTHEAFATFVSLGADRRPAAVPGLITESSEERQMQAHIRSRQALVNKFLADQAALDHEDIPSADAAEAASASTRFRDRVTMQESTLLLRKNFLPRHLNGIGTIFGGDLLEWMEGAALLCASNFTRNTNVVTIAMDRILFKTAIQVDHVLELCARVVYCRQHTVQVECVVTALLPDWCQGAPGEGGEPGEFSHKGYFTILNMTEYGHKRPLAVALDTRDDPAAQRAYRKAHHRFHFWTNAASAGAGEQPCPERGPDSAEGLVDEQQMARGYRSSCSWSSDSSGGLLSTTPPWFHGERGVQNTAKGSGVRPRSRAGKTSETSS